MQEMEHDDDDMMSVIEQMMHDGEDHTDKTLFPPDAKMDAGHTVTITIAAPKGDAPMEEEPDEDDGGYSKLMKGIS